MIRVVTLDEYEPKDVQKLCKLLYTAFGVGTEYLGPGEIPPGNSEPFDAEKLMMEMPSLRTYQADKILYLTRRKLKDRVLVSGTVPTPGFCAWGKQRALITTIGVKDFEAQIKAVGRHALHQLGHTWELHHCLDPRCSMYPPWTPSFTAGDSIFCTFCRDKSEQKIRLEKS